MTSSRFDLGFIHNALKEESVISELENVFKSKSLRFPFFRRIASDEVFPGPPDFSFLSSRFLETTETWIFQYSELYCASIRALSEIIKERFGKFTNTNVYISAPDAAGFGRHSDRSDSIIIQLLGEKDWEFFSSSGSEQFVFSKGSAMYIPQGLEHSVKAKKALSLHLTISLSDNAVLYEKQKNLQNVGIRSFGHLDPREIGLTHSKFGKLDFSAYSEKVFIQQADFECEVVNWEKVRRFESEGFRVLPISCG